MKVALIKDHDIYDRIVLGMSLRDRLKKMLERAGFKVKFFKNGVKLEKVDKCLIIFEPVLILERDLEIRGRCLLTSNNFVFGICLEGVGTEINLPIKNIISENGFKKVEIKAVKLSENNLSELERTILSSLVKSKDSGAKSYHYDGLISSMINRKLSLKISKFLAGRDITPNQITVFSFLLSVLSLPFFLVSSWISNVIGGVIVQLHNVIDGCDGEIARLKFMESKYGAWLDGVLDRCSDFLIIFAITYSLAVKDPIYWIVGFLAMFASMMVPYTGDKFVASFRRAYENPRWLEIPATRDVRLFLIFLFSLVNMLEVALVLIAVLGNAEVVRRIFALKDCKS